MTSLTALFALVVLLVLGVIALSVSVLIRKEGTAGRLALAVLLFMLATAVWLVGIQNPLPLP